MNFINLAKAATCPASTLRSFRTILEYFPPITQPSPAKNPTNKSAYSQRGLKSSSLRPKHPNMYRFDAAAFQSPLTVGAFYWLGFFAGDGCVMGGKYSRIVLKLRKVDAGHVAAFARFMKFTGPLEETDHGRSFRVKLPGRVLTPKLAAFGITPQKTWTLQVTPMLASNVHFWRGFSDADGSIYWRKDRPNSKPRPGFNLSKGSPNILQQAIYYIERALG